MEKLGVWLRQAREAKGSTLEEAEAATCIRPHFLKLLEAGDFAAFPSGEVQVRGFLRIYARYLDLPLDDVLARYDAEAHGLESAIPDATSERAPAELSTSSNDDLTKIEFEPRDISLSSIPRWISLETVLIVGVVLTLLLVVLAIASYVMSQRSGGNAVAAATVTRPTKIASAPISPTLPTATSLNTMPTQPAPTPTSPAVTPVPLANPGGDVTLTLEATEHVWVCVRRGSETVFEEMMAPGQAESWSSEETIVVETGNGAGLRATVNGQAQGELCGRGEVCRRAWRPGGEGPPS